MFDQHLICRDGFRNVVTETGNTEGFEMRIRIPYYRGVPLSVVDTLTVKVAGKTYTNPHIRFTVAGGSYMMSEMETVGDRRWNFDEAAILKIYTPGGLLYIDHLVELDIAIRAPYGIFHGSDKKVLVLEPDKHLCVSSKGGV
ncbi:DUF6379 domain-containing protein [Ruminococcaceae bacterium OttesenSCG-928-D13]|nr:DUF6379 domain-containing protein [Ruminococcaceae bacterium OttesenSCG-928-D13]